MLVEAGCHCRVKPSLCSWKLCSAITHTAYLPSAAAKPCHQGCAFSRGVAGHGPPFPLCCDCQQLAALLMVSLSCHCTLMPSAPSSWMPADSANFHLLTPGLITGWRPKDKAFNGVKKLVLIQQSPAVMSQCWCHPEDCSVCDTTPLVLWAGQVWRSEPCWAKPWVQGLAGCLQQLPKVMLLPCGGNRRAFPVVFPVQSLGAR